MTTKAIAAVIAAVLGIIVLCAAGGAVLLGGGSAGCSLPVAAGPAPSAPAGGWPQIGAYSPDQVAMAATIVSVGAQMGVPVRGWIIGVATAIQESSLSNPTGGDQDSIGLFQQRPSQGWGTPDQLHDPVYAGQKFFAKLLTIPNWQDMPLTDAAQAVQRSAYPDAYAKWEPDATMLVNTVGSGNWRAIPEDLEQCLSNCPEILSSTPVDLQNSASTSPRSESVTTVRTPGLLKISRSGVARIARNGQGSTLRTAHQLAEPTNTVGSGNWRTIPGDLEQCPVNCPGFVNTDGQSSPDPGCLRGIAVLARAATWLTAWGGGPLPYLSSADPATWFDGYRRDCSGFASMALGLASPGLDTAGLAARSSPIKKTDLRAGDLLINAAPDNGGHVVIFDRWVDATMSSYIGYEQSGDGGTHHRVIPFPYFGGYPMSPYRL